MAEDKTIKIQLTEEGSSRDPSQSTPASGPTNEEVEQVLKDYLQSSETIVAAYREAEEALKDLADSSAKAADAAGGGKGGGGGQGTSFDFPDPDDGDSDPFKGYKGPGGSSFDFSDLDAFSDLIDETKQPWEEFIDSIEASLDSIENLNEETEELQSQLSKFATDTSAAVKAIQGLLNGEKEATAAFFKLGGTAGKTALALGALIVAAALYKKAIDEMIERTKNFSAQLAQQLAVNEVAQIQTDIDLADQLGGDLAGLARQGKEIELTVQRAIGNLVETFEPIASAALASIDGSLKVLNYVLDQVVILKDTIEAISERIVEYLVYLTKNIPIIGKTMSTLYNWLKSDNESDEKMFNALEDALLGQLDDPVDPFGLPRTPPKEDKEP